MAVSILSQDILAICIVLADGNIELSIDEVISRTEYYQEDKDRHFGLSRRDFRGLFYYWFIFDLGIKGSDDSLADIKLKDVALDILTYHSAHFNDEGEYWTKERKIAGEEKYLKDIEHWLDYDEATFKEKLIVKQKMKRFFNTHTIEKLRTKALRELMKELEISDKILFDCSRPGESS